MGGVGKLDMTLYQGTTFRKTLIWKTGDPAVSVNLSGYTARMQARRKLSDPEILFELTTENGGIALTSAEGKITLYLSDVQTTALEGRAVYDLEVVAPNNDVIRLVEGRITISPEVTR